MILSIGSIIALGSLLTIFVIIAIIATAVMTSNKYSIIKDTNKDVILLSDEIINKVQDNFNDKITEYTGNIDLIKPEEINKKYNININHKNIEEGLNDIIKKIESSINDSIKDCVSNIKIPELEPITVIPPELPTQKIEVTKLNNKTLYDIIPDKYIDLLDREINNIIINNNILKYIGNINIIINCSSLASEFWYIEIQKDKNTRYGLNLKQKKRLKKIINYVYFSKNVNFKPSAEDFNFIKGKIDGN